MSSGALTRNAVRDAINRSYDFANHGISYNSRRTRHRGSRRSRRNNTPYGIDAPDEFMLREFADAGRLYAVVRELRQGGLAPGRNGFTYDDFTVSEILEALRVLVETLIDRTYRPGPSRLVNIPKGDGRYRTLILQLIMDRVVAKALHLLLKSYWRRLLPGFGRSVWEIFALLQRLIREQDAYTLAIDDIRDCYPSVSIDAVIDSHRNHIREPDLFWLIETVLRGHDGPEEPTGLYQGSPYSPVAMELTLHTHLFALLDAEYGGLPFLIGYVDNLNILCRNASEGEDVLQRCRELLVPLGLTLKGEDGAPFDLRDETHGTRILGLIPIWQNGQLTFSIPESGYDDLEEGLEEALMAPEPFTVAKAVVKGWIEAIGPAFTQSYGQDIMDRVISLTTHWGFSDLDPDKLRRVGHQSRQRWLSLCEEDA